MRGDLSTGLRFRLANNWPNLSSLGLSGAVTLVASGFYLWRCDLENSTYIRFALNRGDLDVMCILS